MLWKKRPPLRTENVEKILRYLEFTYKPLPGDHGQITAPWTGMVNGELRVVTLQIMKEPYSDRMIKTIIENTGVIPSRFYDIHDQINN